MSNRSKKILVLNYEFPPLGGGASPVSYELAKGYVKKGYTVDVVTMHYADLPKQEQLDGMTIYRVPSIRKKKEICRPWEQLSYLISAKKFLRNHLKDHSYDFVHCHFLIPTGILAVWLKDNYGIPFIVTAHGSDVPGHNTDRFKLLHKFTGPMLRKVCNKAHKVVSPSKYLKDLILHNITKNVEIEVIPNGIYIDNITPQKKEKIILSTGRFVPLKGFQYLIKAVSNEDLGYELHLAGDGPLMKEFQELARKSKTPVIFHGWMNNRSQEYKDLLGKAEIYVLASSKENASISLLEGMSAGCTVITTNVSGCPETVGDSGILFPPHNPTELNKAIKQAISPKSKNYGSLARHRVESTFDWEKVIYKYLQILGI